MGHTDSRFDGDGEPALGWIENLRLADGGNTLVGDLVGVPSWLNDVMASAYPDRSIEGAYGRRCALNHTHPFVLDGLALLGVTRPGVGTLKPIGGLDDVREMFAPTVAASSGEVRIAASIPGSAIAAADGKPGNGEKLKRFWTYGRGGIELIKWQPQEGSFDRCVHAIREHVPTMSDPEGYCATLYRRVHGEWPGRHSHDRKKVDASDDGGLMPNPEPSLADRVREAWNASGAPFSQHVHQVRGSTAIVLDEADRSFWRVPVAVDGDTVSFGAKERVMPDFVDYDEQAIAASVVFASREESRPNELDWNVAPPTATVLDSPSPIEQLPPNPILPAEPATPATPPDEPPPTEEPLTPPQPGGVSVPAEKTPDAESEQQQVHTEPKEGPVPDMSELRSRLGLADDADEAAILTAVDALKTKADTPPQPDPQQVAAAAAARDEMKAEISRLSTELAEIKATAAVDAKKALFDRVVDEGRIAPADRAGWEGRYDKAPDVIAEVLASIAPNTAVPVAAAGYTGTGDEGIDDEYEKLVAGIDGPHAQKAV